MHKNEGVYFSVIVPVYNVQQYLEQCIESVLRQSYTNYEIILVDDGSTDGSTEICDRYVTNYPFVKVIHQENGGISAARNTGLDCATGKYVLFLDSDDFISSNALQSFYEVTAESGVEAVSAYNYVYTDENGIADGLSFRGGPCFIRYRLFHKGALPTQLLSSSVEQSNEIVCH